MAILREYRLGVLEAGGTKMVCTVGNEQDVIMDQIVIPRETPEITMPQIIAFFKYMKSRLWVSPVLVHWI